MNSIMSVLSGPSGKTSSMRVATLLCVVVILGTWCSVSIQKKELQPLSIEQTAIVLGAMGIKAAQRGNEAKEEKNGNSAS